MTKNNCEICKNEFLGKKTTRFCSRRCGTKSMWSNGSFFHRKAVKKICLTCGTEFGGQGKKFCSVVCSNLGKAKPSPKGKKREHVCANCGLSFRGYGQRKFCSRKCSLSSPHSSKTKELIGIAHRGISKTEEHKKKLRGPRPQSRGRKPPNWNPDREEQRRKKFFYGLCIGLLHRVIDPRGIKKNRPKEEMLGFSADDLRQHLEKHWLPGMTWENYGKRPGCWQIDHTRPVSSFSIDTNVNIINALDNLRPMWMTENLSKGSRWIEQENSTV